MAANHASMNVPGLLFKTLSLLENEKKTKSPCRIATRVKIDLMPVFSVILLYRVAPVENAESTFLCLA